MTERYEEILKTRSLEAHSDGFADSIISQSQNLKQSKLMDQDLVDEFNNFDAEEEFTGGQVFAVPNFRVYIAAALILSFSIGLLDIQGFEQAANAASTTDIQAIDMVISEGVF